MHKPPRNPFYDPAIDGDEPEKPDPIRTSQFGRAGTGLNDEQAKSRFGKSALVGAVGERRFQEALARAGFSTRYDVHYSLRMPHDPTNPRSRKRYSGDIDLAVSNGRRVLLLDVKRFAANHVYWTIFGKPMKGLTPMMKEGYNGEPAQWRLSQNMLLARSRFEAGLPGVAVKAMVVFVPTNERGDVPTLINFTYPGGIRSYLTNDAIRKAEAFLGDPQPVDPKVRGFIGSLVK